MTVIIGTTYFSMPPYCSAIDSSVVKAAKKAIRHLNIFYILPWVPPESEQELHNAFNDAMHARENHLDAQKVADCWFIETAVRLHLQGEGNVFTGMKTMSAARSPALVIAEKILEEGNIQELINVLHGYNERRIRLYFGQVNETADFDPSNLPAAREHVQAILDFFYLADRSYKIAQWKIKERENILIA